MADNTRQGRESGRRRHSRSRSPRRHHSHSHRRRSPHDSHHRSIRPTEVAPEPLPYNCRPITKHDYDSFKPMFASYLDIQKGMFLDELGDTEVKGRWKSFMGKWNRGELSEGWYDPSTLRKAQESAKEYEDEIARESNPIQSNEPSSSFTKRESEYDDLSRVEGDENDSDDSIGPTLPGEMNKARRNRPGPSIPNMEDLELKRGICTEP
ncbi:hypothetical protein OCU04_010431 [Sclerotinia nivalis]|uniref:Uncharacterized protein n=1 Tax=Sclerotinia nivalis TaxID=352851 RepID=A0A9X0AEN1_9HELO|nr:hypothetical protein OCU04_010431 [Sclerotinia nivalis]